VKPLLDVLLKQTPKRRPIWIMRQAGRYLPEYKKVRETAGSFLQLCYNPELACEVTLQPLRRFDLDAAILFSDILVVPHAMGLSLDFREGEGPVLQTVSNLAEIERLAYQGSFAQFDHVWETVGLVRSSLAPHLSLIGFCGAPWTVASYMIEGGSSDRKRALAVAQENPVWFQVLLDRVIETSIVYLLGQVKLVRKRCRYLIVGLEICLLDCLTAWYRRRLSGLLMVSVKFILIFRSLFLRVVLQRAMV